jgi:type III secretory pathway component EscV
MKNTETRNSILVVALAAAIGAVLMAGFEEARPWVLLALVIFIVGFLRTRHTVKEVEKAARSQKRTRTLEEEKAAALSEEDTSAPGIIDAEFTAKEKEKSPQ